MLNLRFQNQTLPPNWGCPPRDVSRVFCFSGKNGLYEALVVIFREVNIYDLGV